MRASHEFSAIYFDVPNPRLPSGGFAGDGGRFGAIGAMPVYAQLLAICP
jgi:hypothetical protein